MWAGLGNDLREVAKNRTLEAFIAGTNFSENLCNRAREQRLDQCRLKNIQEVGLDYFRTTIKPQIGYALL